MSNSKYDVEAVRKKVRDMVGNRRDPFEFKPPKCDPDKTLHYRFFILPPFEEHDQLSTDKAQKSMNGVFFIEHGSHWINNQRLGCPRVINNEECPVCTYAFETIMAIKANTSLNEEAVKQQVSRIGKDLLPATSRLVNIYFIGGKIGSCNPPDLQDKVFYYNASTTVFNAWQDCLYRDDDGGDPIQPLPYGIFYDEDNSYLFDLCVTKKNMYNSYEGSKFLVTESVRTMPIYRDAGGGPDREQIARILNARHDLFAKIPTVDYGKLNTIVNELRGNSPSSSSGGFTMDESTMATNQVQNQQSATNNVPVQSAQTTSQTTTNESPPFDDVDPFANEVVANSKPAQQTQQSSVAVATTASTSAVTDSEIEALLSQMEGR